MIKLILHELKTINPFFQEIWSRQKLFDVRKKDRNFKVGDKLHLREYDLKTGVYSGRNIKSVIIYIMDDGNYCKEGFVILQLSFAIERWHLYST